MVVHLIIRLLKLNACSHHLPARLLHHTLRSRSMQRFHALSIPEQLIDIAIVIV